MAERVIGIDFGTSTSVIRVKRYLHGKALGDMRDTIAVTFNMGNSMTPTLIRRVGDDPYYGHAAESPRRNSVLYYDFKVDLENAGNEIREQARALTEEYLSKHLAKTYLDQSKEGHLGESDDVERTIISYPVKWKDETKRFMVEAAKNAGFKNVEGMDEAQAAICAVTVQNAEFLSEKGYFKPGVPVNILLIDMGAGTTDFVVCRHTPGEEPETDPLCTYPTGETALFGGREADELLRGYIRAKLPEAEAEKVLGKCGIEQFKAWKEQMVSPALQKGETVNEFSALENITEMLEIGMEPIRLDRKAFEACAEAYLRQFPELVGGCVKEAKKKVPDFNGNDIDLVILTGGHSQWYFVREMLAGNMPGFGRLGLGKIEAEPERVVSITRPQETVALGLAFSPISRINALTPQPSLPDPENTPEKGNVDPDSVMNLQDDGAIPEIPELRPAEKKPLIYAQPNESKKADDPFPLQYDPRSMVRPVIYITGEVDIWGVTEGGKLIGAFPTLHNNYNIVNTINITTDNIISVSNGVYLQADGKPVPIHGFNSGSVAHWNEIVAISSSSDYYGLTHSGTVYKNGAFLQNEAIYKNGDLTALAAITTSHHFSLALGLNRNGTVNIVNSKMEMGIYWYSLSFLNKLNHVVAVVSRGTHFVILQDDGTVFDFSSADNPLMLSEYYEPAILKDWKVIAVAAGDHHTVGLRNDGTVIATGSNSNGQCEVSAWKNIIAIAAGSHCTVGIKEDGGIELAYRQAHYYYENKGFVNRILYGKGKEFWTSPRPDISSFKLF